MYDKESRLGELLIREGLISELQLHDALRAQRKGSTYLPLGQVLVQRQHVTRRQLDLIMDQGGKRLRLGDVLVRSGALTPDQLDHALEEQKRRRQPLGQVLVDLNFLTDDAMRQALALHLNIPFLDLDRVTIDRELAKRINATYARRHALVPVSVVGQSLTIAMDDPTNRSVVEELMRSTGLIVSIVTAARDAIQRAFNRVYGGEHVAGADSESAGTVDVITVDYEQSSSSGKSKYLDDQRQDQKAGEFVRQIIRIAIERGCSDIHLETLSEGLRLRFRTDGVLQELQLGPLQENIQRSGRRIVSRVKIMAKLDIGERRRPQDGSFRVMLERNGEQVPIDFRVSVVPGYYGESLVMRVLDRRGAPGSLNQLGFSREVTARMQNLLKRSTGIFLVTGPTGSGKSTTLYASLMTLYRPQIRILTAEDPIEYVYDQFSQSEVNERIGNTFATYLRAFLRHDPEVIMVGEIRDEDTASMAFRAAQTGHLVLSTLHTNTAIGAINRLLDLRVDPNLLASSMIGVLSQRLVREVCHACKTPYEPSRELLKEFFDVPPAIPWYKGRGCEVCNFSGYKGRMSVAELWTPDERDVILISKNANFDDVRESSKRSTISMTHDVADRLIAGRTNLEELIRVLPYSAVYEFRHFDLDALDHAEQA